MPDQYKQAVLCRVGAHGIIKDTVWIPTSFARIGKTLHLKADDTAWWVDEVYEGVKEREELDVERATRREFSVTLDSK